MEELVAQGVDAVEDNGEDAGGVLFGQGVVGGPLGGGEAVLPLVFGF